MNSHATFPSCLSPSEPAAGREAAERPETPRGALSAGASGLANVGPFGAPDRLGGWQLEGQSRRGCDQGGDQGCGEYLLHRWSSFALML